MFRSEYLMEIIKIHLKIQHRNLVILLKETHLS